MTRPKTLDEHNRDIWTFGGWLLAISVLGTIGAVCITSLLYDEDEST